jgi:hypothetical protein
MEPLPSPRQGRPVHHVLRTNNHRLQRSSRAAKSLEKTIEKIQYLVALAAFQGTHTSDAIHPSDPVRSAQRLESVSASVASERLWSDQTNPIGQ